MKNNQKKSSSAEVLEVPRPDSEVCNFKDMGGGKSDRWNKNLTDALCRALPTSYPPFASEIQMASKIANLVGISDCKPSDPIEGMLLAHILAANATGLELQRRAWLENQTFDARTRFLALADKSARTVATLVETLNRHRGKGAQVVRVERVVVNEGAQAVVGVVNGGGASAKTEDQPHAKELPDASLSPMLCPVKAERTTLPGTGGARNEGLPDARR